MASAAVRARLLQALDIIHNFSSQFILDLHIRQHGSKVQDLFVGQLADAAGRVNVEAGEEAGRGVVANSEEALEGFLCPRSVKKKHLPINWVETLCWVRALKGKACLEQVPLGEIDAHEENLQK